MADSVKLSISRKADCKDSDLIKLSISRNTVCGACGLTFWRLNKKHQFCKKCLIKSLYKVVPEKAKTEGAIMDLGGNIIQLK